MTPASGEGRWTPPRRLLGDRIPAQVASWLDQRACVMLATIDPDGRPQLTVVWAMCRDGAVLMTTVKGRRKHTNLLSDPRATLLVTPPGDPDRYVEMRGTIDLLEHGGRELIDELHARYRGVRPYPWDGEGDERVVLRFRPSQVCLFEG